MGLIRTLSFVSNRHPQERTCLRRRIYYKDTRLGIQLGLRDSLEAGAGAL